MTGKQFSPARYTEGEIFHVDSFFALQQSFDANTGTRQLRLIGTRRNHMLHGGFPEHGAENICGQCMI